MTARERLGCLTALVAAVFGTGLLVSMGRAAWFAADWKSSLLAFFGFGIPMVLLGVATYHLCEDSPPGQVYFGWGCVVFGLFWAVGLFVLIADWVNIIALNPVKVGFWEGSALFLGFVVPMLVCGGMGISTVIESSKKQTKRESSS